MPDDLKTNPALQAYTDVASLAKSHIHAQSLIGKKGVFVPTEKASEDDWKAFYKNVGQPELDKFDVKLPEGVQVRPEFVKGFKENAHKAGLLPKQAQGLIDWYLQHEQTTVAADQKDQKAQAEAAVEGLRKEWGAGFDKQVALAKMGIKELGGEEFQAHLVKIGVASDPLVAKFMAKVGALLGEDKLVGDGSGKFGQTNSELQNEIEKLQVHPAYADSRHGDHARVNREMESLYQKMYASKTG